MADGPRRGSRWTTEARATGGDYDRTWERLEESGENPHGEADFIEFLGVTSVLDAGCGTGRVAIELARRGHSVVGVDLDLRMLGTARQKAPNLVWEQADLSSLALAAPEGDGLRSFDAVVMAGNVMIFLEPGTEATVVDRLGAHLSSNGILVAGFQLRSGGLTLEDYDSMTAAAGLSPQGRYSTWSREPFSAQGDYAVSVHTRG